MGMEGFDSAGINADVSSTSEPVTPGSTGVNFDDLDGVESPRQTAKRTPKQEESKKIQQQPTGDGKDAKVEIPKEIKGKERHKDKAGEAGGTKQVAAGESEDGAAEIEKEIKKLRAKFNDEDIELPEDAQFIAKVKGEEIPVSARELLNNFSGKTAWDRKFTELDKERQQLIPVAQKISQFESLAKEGKEIEALDFLLDAGGFDPHNFYKKLREFVIPSSEEYFALSDDERKAVDLEKENEFLKKQNESYLNKRQREQRTQQLTEELTSVREAHGLSESDMKSAYEQLVGNPANQGKEITPPMIAAFAVKYKNGMRVWETFNQINPELTKRSDLYNAVCDIVDRDPSIMDEDLVDLITRVTGIKSDRKKVEEKVSKQKAEVEKKHSASSNEEKFMSFDDFDDY